MNISDALFVLLITFWGFFVSRKMPLIWELSKTVVVLLGLIFLSCPTGVQVWMGVSFLCSENYSNVLYLQLFWEVFSCIWRRSRSFVGENPDVWWFQCTVDLFVSVPRVIIEKERTTDNNALLLVIYYIWGCHSYLFKIRVCGCGIYTGNHQNKWACVMLWRWMANYKIVIVRRMSSGFTVVTYKEQCNPCAINLQAINRVRPVYMMNDIICLPIFKLNFCMFSDGDVCVVCLVFGHFSMMFCHVLFSSLLQRTSILLIMTSVGPL